MPVGISFGSGTSGTGFDVASTVSSIMSIQRTPETAWAARTNTLQTQDSALTVLGTNVSALSTALGSLTSFDGVFASKGGATSNTDAIILTNVGNSASIASHTLTVSRLAQTSQYYSGAVASSATLSGTLKLTVGGNETDLNIASGSTVAQVASQINSSSAGVKASVITDSNGSRLSLTSGTTGSAGELTVDSSALTNSATSSALGFTESQAGVDAAYTLDGASLTSSSNTVSSALTGVTFQLLATTTNTSNPNVTLQVAADTSSVSTTIQSFVTAYNALTKALVAQEAKDSSGNAMPLFGNPVVSQLQSSLTTALNFTGATNSSSSASSSSSNAVTLSTLGLSVGADGTLTLDSSALNAALSSKLDSITSFFQVSGQFGQNFANTLNTLGSTGTGAIALALKNNSDEESTLADNKTNLETRLSTYESNLTTELTTANEILQAIPQQLKGITALFNAITGNTSS